MIAGKLELEDNEREKGRGLGGLPTSKTKTRRPKANRSLGLSINNKEPSLGLLQPSLRVIRNSKSKHSLKEDL